MDVDFFLHLTDVGREVAEQTYEKHCFFTHLLTEAGVDPKTAEQEACRMEHVISESSFRHLKQSMDKDVYKRQMPIRFWCWTTGKSFSTAHMTSSLGNKESMPTSF